MAYVVREVGDCLLKVLLGLCPLLSLVHLRLGLLLNGGVGVLNEILVRLLSLSLGAGGIGLHRLGIVDDLLDHAHNTSSGTALLVLLESWRRRRALVVLLLKESSLLLLVESLEDVQSCGQKLLRGTLVGDNLLELLVLLLAVLTCTLQFGVELSNLRLECVDLSGQSLDSQIEVLNEGNEVVLLTVLTLSLELVGVELLNAEVLVLDLILLLSQKLGDHVINGLLHADESIELHLDGDGCETRALVLQGSALQDGGGGSAALVALLLLDESWVECLGEQVVRLIGAQHGKSLGASFHLELAGLLALLPLGVSASALLLQHHEESFILGE